MVDSVTKVSGSCQIYRSVEIRPRILLRADSVPSTYSSSNPSKYHVPNRDAGERVFNTMSGIRTCLQSIFQTKNSIICVGYCNNEMEMILTNFVDDSDTVLVGVIGKMGRDAVDILNRIGANVCTIKAPTGQALDYDQIEAQMELLQPNVFFIVHGENSTGVLQPIDRIGDLCQKNDCLFIVDAVDTLGAVKLSVDDWKIAVAYGGSQKGLGGCQGIVPLAFDQRALNKLKMRKTRVSNSLWDVKMLNNAWRTYDESKFLYSDLVPVIFLHEFQEHLNKIINEGLTNVIERHSTNSQRLQIGLEKMIGLELFVEMEQFRLPTVVTVKMPLGINDKSFTKYLSNKHFIEISPGVGGTNGQIIRIGLVSSNANRKTVENILKAFYDALKSMIPDYISHYSNARAHTYYY